MIVFSSYVLSHEIASYQKPMTYVLRAMKWRAPVKYQFQPMRSILKPHWGGILTIYMTS